MKISSTLLKSVNFVSRYLLGSGVQANVSADIVCKSHRLMQQAQLISSAGPGLFSMLPLGVRSLEKLARVIEEEMSQLGCQKVSLPCMSGATPWKKSGRWEYFGDELIKLRVANSDHCLSPTHEEAISKLVSSVGLVPKNSLPLKLYQMTTKFRDEPRPRYGLLRCREFLMKDLYTFDNSQEAALETYQQVGEAYESIFKTLGLEYIKADSAVGNIGGILSHEYLVPSPIGEDLVFVDETGKAWNKQVGETRMDENVKKVSAIEIGHTFNLGTMYSKLFDACFRDSASKHALEMGCFGLGVTRMLASCVEVFSTENGIRWPYEIAPFKVCILPPKSGSKEEKQIGSISTDIYMNLETLSGLEDNVILDDRLDKTIGRRLHDAEIIGYPIVIVMGKHILDREPRAEVIFQNKNETMLLPASDMFQVIGEELEKSRE